MFFGNVKFSTAIFLVKKGQCILLYTKLFITEYLTISNYFLRILHLLYIKHFIIITIKYIISKLILKISVNFYIFFILLKKHKINL